MHFSEYKMYFPCVLQPVLLSLMYIQMLFYIFNFQQKKQIFREEKVEMDL